MNHNVTRAGSRWSKTRLFSLIFILMLLIASSLTSLFALRDNNLTMQDLRSKVAQADKVYYDKKGKEGTKAQLEYAMHQLGSYIVTHMNTHLSPNKGESSNKPIQLIHKYNRDTISLWQRHIEEVGVDTQILNQAIRTCHAEQVSPEETLGCLQNKTRDESSLPAIIPLDKDYYVYDFYSPFWSPDLAGWSLVVLAFSIGALMIRMAV